MRRIQRARLKANELLRSEGITRAPVDVFEFARSHSRIVGVEQVELEDDISGALLPVDSGKWLIVVNSLHSETRQRFTVAHELGHMLLHEYSTPHADRRMKLRDARSSEGSALEEIEANQFASELLMPREFMLKELRRHVLEYSPEDDKGQRAYQELVTTLAEKFAVSEQAMMIRISALLA